MVGSMDLSSRGFNKSHFNVSFMPAINLSILIEKNKSISGC